MYAYEDTHKIPPEPLAWLRKYNLTAPEITEFSYDSKRQHLIFRQDGFSNARNFDPQDDRKYVSYGDKPYSVRGNGEWLVCVEDAISGIKVSRHTACMILFGSSVPVDRVLMAMNQFVGVLFWLDPDKITASAMMAKNLRSFGFDVRTVPALKDPKDYEDAEIATILKKATA